MFLRSDRFLRVAESGDLAVAAHHFPRTDSDVDDGVAISDSAGGDEGSSGQEIHDVPIRRQLAGQRSRRELFRRLRDRFKTSKHQVRPMGRPVGEHEWSENTLFECLRPNDKTRPSRVAIRH